MRTHTLSLSFFRTTQVRMYKHAYIHGIHTWHQAASLCPNDGAVCDLLGCISKMPHMFTLDTFLVLLPRLIALLESETEEHALGSMQAMQVWIVHGVHVCMPVCLHIHVVLVWCMYFCCCVHSYTCTFIHTYRMLQALPSTFSEFVRAHKYTERERERFCHPYF